MSETRTLKQIYQELVSTPFFPLLFITEAVKTAVGSGPTVEFSALAVVATFMWAVSDKVDVDVAVNSENGFLK